MKREFVVFSLNFFPTCEFSDYLESLGYNVFDINSVGFVNKLGADSRVVKYVKEHTNWTAYDHVKYALKGIESNSYRCGFSGAAFIIEADTDRSWELYWGNYDEPLVRYVDIKTSEYGQIYKD